MKYVGFSIPEHRGTTAGVALYSRVEGGATSTAGHLRGDTFSTHHGHL